MKKVLDFFENLIKDLGKDYKWKNVNFDVIPVDDYQMENALNVPEVPFDRVVEDRKKCIEMIGEFFSVEKDINQRELVLAIYCNFYIKHGMAGRFQKENKAERYDGLDKIFASIETEQIHLKELYTIVKEQDYDGFDRILEKNSESIVAKMYKFVKLCHEYCQEVAENSKTEVIYIDQYKEVWDLYESIPKPWDQYILGDGELIRNSNNYAWDLNLLPYIRFLLKKDILVEYISWYYSSILDRLGIERTINPGYAYREIINKLGIVDTYNFAIRIDPQEWVDIYQMRDAFSKLIELIGKNMIQFGEMEDDVTFLVEKIHELLNCEKTEWIDSKSILAQYDFKDMYPVLRNGYLHLPVFAPMKRELFLSQYDVYLKNRALQKNRSQKQEMMDYYVHSWKHISYPQIVKEIAEELGNSNRVMANRLMKAYNSERTLQRGIQLLQYISSDDEEKVSREFRSGMAKSGVNSDKAITLYNVICDSLDLVVFKILMVESDDSSSIERCREKWGNKKSLNDLREEYTSKFLGGLDDKGDVLCWVNDNLISIKLTIDSAWEQVRFKDDSFAVNQFKEILVEIFTNVFLHGEQYMKLDFASNDSEMLIQEENACSDLKAGSRSGISTMQRVLEYINIGTDIKSIETRLSDTFGITIRINKKVLVRKGR